MGDTGSASRLRIALLTSEYPPFAGGVATYARELAIAAVAAGHDVTVLAPDYGAEQTVADTALPGRTVRFAGGPASMKGIGRRIAATRRLLRDGRFDIVHAIDWPFFIPLRLARRRAPGARLLLTVHGSEILYMQHARRRLPLAAIGFWQRGWAEWIANSRYTRDLLVEAFPSVGSAATRAIPLGVGRDWIAGRVDRAAARDALAVTSDRVVIVSLGRVVPRKGHIDLAAALALLPDALATRVDWWVIGPLLDPDHDAALRAAAARSSARTTIFGGLPGDEVRQRLSAADLFCLPGYQDGGGRVEGFGLVFLEAGAYGVPSVATRSGGIPEAVEDGVTGLLVPERDPPALAAALTRLIEDTPLRRRLAAAAEARAAAATWDGVMRSTYDR